MYELQLLIEWEEARDAPTAGSRDARLKEHVVGWAKGRKGRLQSRFMRLEQTGRDYGIAHHETAC